MVEIKQYSLLVENMNKNISKLIADIVLKCLQNKISFELKCEPHLSQNNIKCSGFFDDTTLSVATKKPLFDWLTILIHESCHMDQFLEKSPYWDMSNDHINTIDKWLDNKNINDKKLKKAFHDIIILELDCEKRSAKKIQKYKLPINKDLYIQKANSYLFSYWATNRDRKWFEFPYLNPKIYKKMPKTFLSEKEYLNKNCKYLELYK